MKLEQCLWCKKPLPKGRRKYCSDECSLQYWRHNIVPFWWNVAKSMAKERADHKCEECGKQDHLEVHHKEKLADGEDYHNSPKNRQDNLLVLCRTCHENEHHSHIRNEREAVKLQDVLL